MTLTRRSFHLLSRKTNFLLVPFGISAILSCVTLSISKVAAQSESVKIEMRNLYSPLRDLLPYLASEPLFTAPESKGKVATALEELQRGFHSVETIPSRYKSMPGFSVAVSQLREILDDSVARLAEGKTRYAWWRSRVIPGACFSCHATYNVKSVYSADTVVDSALPEMDRARFLLATRQFPQAEEALLKVLKTPSSRIDFGEALRSILVVELRVYGDFPHTISTLQNISRATKLSQEDEASVQRWTKTLLGLGKKLQPKDEDLFNEGERLVSAGLPKTVDESADSVLLLLGGSYLQRALELGNLPPVDRSRALHLIGRTYALFSSVLYFADSWSALYLEQCISEFPGSEAAKASYKVYHESILNEFTGSSGSNVPQDVSLKLEQLRKKAHAIPEFQGKS